jgi:hypothetical protein
MRMNKKDLRHLPAAAKVIVSFVRTHAAGEMVDVCSEVRQFAAAAQN